MTLKETLKQLKALGNEATRKHNAKWGAGDNQFGVKLGDLRMLAKKIKTNHELALSLWKTGNVDAQFLAVAPDQAEGPVGRRDGSAGAVRQLCARGGLAQLLRRQAARRQGDASPEMDGRRRPLGGPRRMAASPPSGSRRARTGSTCQRCWIASSRKWANADPDVQWTMNSTLAEIGIHFPKLRKRAIAIGEKLGIYRDYPVSKGCTSPFAPIWINAMVSRQG